MNRRIALALLLAVLAFGLRFHHLGEWSFSGDETTTIIEEGVLFRGLEADPDGQLYKLPRVNPLGYLIHTVAYRIFGYDEFGTRAIGALFSSAQVVLLFLLLVGLLGEGTAFAVAMMVCLWPQHLAAAQDNRFYVFAGVFVSLSLLLGAHAVKLRSAKWMGGAVLFAFLAILTHAVQGLLIGTLISGVLAAAWVEKKKPDKKTLMVLGGAVLVAILYLALRLVPLTRGWNQGSGWGYSTPHSVLAAMSSIGLQYALLLPAGALLLFKEKTPVAWYWLACSLSWAFVVVVLPNAVVYHPPYAFPLEVTAFVLVGAVLGRVFDLLEKKGALIAWAFLGGAVLANAPGVASHLRDGSRYDYKTIAHHLGQVRKPGDAVAARSPDLLKHYEKSLDQVAPIYADDALPAFEELVATSTRTWVVVHNGRSGLPGPLTRFLGQRCVPELDIKAKRFDYYDYRTALYLCSK